MIKTDRQTQTEGLRDRIGCALSVKKQTDTDKQTQTDKETQIDRNRQKDTEIESDARLSVTKTNRQIDNHR